MSSGMYKFQCRGLSVLLYTSICPGYSRRETSRSVLVMYLVYDVLIFVP